MGNKRTGLGHHYKDSDNHLYFGIAVDLSSLSHCGEKSRRQSILYKASESKGQVKIGCENVCLFMFHAFNLVLRETVPSVTLDMRKKTVSVLAHSFFCNKGLTRDIYYPYPA